MKVSALEKSIKSSVRKHYVRKKELDALKKQIKLLNKKLAELQKSGRGIKPGEDSKKAKGKAKNRQTAAAGQPKNSEQNKLTRIKGIGPVLESKLHNLGIDKFSQIADWNEQDIEKVSGHLNFKGRIEREEWIKQANELV
ncbi:MAG: hypothetical protein GY792_27525 [Gammaproteobacteria bacterium]|nr:hypothetical protein [Gammaproteobacteria bacterium]